jgi:hypothetical protein
VPTRGAEARRDRCTERSSHSVHSSRLSRGLRAERLGPPTVVWSYLYGLLQAELVAFDVLHDVVAPTQLLDEANLRCPEPDGAFNRSIDG